MRTEIRESLGLKYSVANWPDTVEEFDTAAKRQGACLEEATSNVAYRGTNAQFRKALLEKVETETKVERKTKTVSNKNGTTREEWDESESIYFNRVLKETGKKASDFQPLADTITGIVFDPSAKEPSAGPGPSKAYLNAAKALLAEAGEKLARAVANIRSALGREPNVTSAEEFSKEIKAWKEKQPSLVDQLAG